MSKIKALHAREILDSRGNPTIEVEVIVGAHNNIIGRASVPSGASTGQHEAVEWRDGGIRYGGKGVLRAVHTIETVIRDALLEHDVRYQKGIDDILIQLDNTPNKRLLGANAILAVSLAIARAAAQTVGMPLYQYLNQGNNDSSLLPVPLINIINGGAHADNTLDIQEFMIMPIGAPTFKEALRFGAETFHALKNILKQQGLNTAVGDEGGFAPNLTSHEAAIQLILEAIEKAGFRAGQDICIALDLASSEFFSDNHYHLKSENKIFNREQWVTYLKQLVAHYPIMSLEDGMAEDDWQGWKLLSEAFQPQIQLVGDDIFVTNVERLAKGIAEKIGNAILIKPNQIGTLTETCNAIQLAVKAQYATVISHRSGETEDTFIADLAVATNARQIKAGSVSRSDRVAKYNQLLRIEEALGSKAQYAGKMFQ